MTRLGIITIFLFNCLFAIGQQEKDTILVSKGFTTVLIFDDPLLESIIGNSDEFLQDHSQSPNERIKSILKLSYNRAAKERANMTNLTVITESGSIHNFILKYSDSPGKLIWKIKSPSEEQRTERTDRVDSLETVLPLGHNYGLTKQVNSSPNESEKLDKLSEGTSRRDSLYNLDRDEYYRLKSYYLRFNDPDIKLNYSYQGKLSLHLLGVYYDREEIYMHLKVENGNTIDLDIDFLEYYIRPYKRKGITVADTQVFPLYNYKEPSSVKGKGEAYFVVVFNKFTLDEKLRFHVEMKESRGARSLDLSIEPRYINDPIKGSWWNN